MLVDKHDPLNTTPHGIEGGLNAGMRLGCRSPTKGLAGKVRRVFLNKKKKNGLVAELRIRDGIRKK